MQYSIRQVSDQTDLSEHALRFYEKEGLLPPIERSPSGIRRYSDEDIECLNLICCLKNTGMSIRQIKSFMELCARGPETLKERCEMLCEHKSAVEVQIEEMNRHLVKVTHKISCFTAQYEEYRDGCKEGESAFGAV